MYVFENDFSALLHSGPEPGTFMSLDAETSRFFVDPPVHPLMQSAAAKGTWSVPNNKQLSTNIFVVIQPCDLFSSSF